MKKYDWNNAFPEKPDKFHERVERTLMRLPENKELEEMKMRKKKAITWKKGIIIAAAATMLLGTSAFAAGQITSIVGTSSSKPNYRKMPSTAAVQKEAGFSPKLVETFQSGYTFDGGYIVKNEAQDENGDAVKKYKEFEIDYVKGEDTISLYMDNASLPEGEEDSAVAEIYKGIDLKYTSYMNKFVPSDYKETDQDKKDEESGKYVFSYGSDKLEVKKIQGLSWKEDGINYSFCLMDSPLTKEDIVKMAEEIIESK